MTGAGHRVGKAIALSLAREGASVAVHYYGSAAAADALVADLARAGQTAHAFPADLRDPASPPRLIEAVSGYFGALDLLVNSAAVMRRTPVDTVTVDEWDSMFALNLRAPFFLTQAAHPWLSQRQGAVINIADLAAFETWPAYVPHGITKAGVVQMTRALAHALAPEVRVNAVAPGAVLLPDDWDPAAGARLAATTPLRRLGTPEDVAGAVVYLATAGYVTGVTVVVDGGRHVRR